MLSLRPIGRRAARARRGVALALLVCLPPGPARAVVGGTGEAGPLARASVMVLNSKGGVCSGVVVAPDAILTAGHCASGADQFRVHFRGPDGAPVLLAPMSVAVHPGYDPGAVAGRRRSIDLALLRLAEPLPGSFAPALLASSAPARGETVRLGGYGVARDGDARSTGTFRGAELTAVEPYGASTILLWASDPTRRGAGACQGDSGGPIAREGGAVVAVTTWAAGHGRGGCGAMSQGVLVGPQRGWIDRVLSSWRRAAVWQ